LTCIIEIKQNISIIHSFIHSFIQSPDMSTENSYICFSYEKKGYYLDKNLTFEGTRVVADTFDKLLEKISTKPNSWTLQMGGINKEINRRTNKIEYTVRKGKQPTVPGGDCWKKYPSCWIFVGHLLN